MASTPEPLPPAQGEEYGKLGVYGNHWHAISKSTVVWFAADGAAYEAPRPQMRPPSRAPFDAADAPCGDLSGAGSEAHAGIAKWNNYYNAEGPHSTHGILTPDEVYDNKTEPVN